MKEKTENLMDRTRAAVCLINTNNWNSKAGEYFAFLSLIHPEITLQKRLKLARDMTK